MVSRAHAGRFRSWSCCFKTSLLTRISFVLLSFPLPWLFIWQYCCWAHGSSCCCSEGFWKTEICSRPLGKPSCAPLP